MSTGASSVHLPSLSQAEFDVLGEHVFCDDQIAIEWKVISSLPGEPELKRRDSQNERVLRALSLVEEHDETQSDVAERAEFHRLEGKVDLVLELLTVLVKSSQGARELRSARFNSRGLCWNSNQSPPEGALLDVDCYLLAQWPLPLKLCARVVESAARAEQFRVCTRIEGLGHVSRDWFGKLVFRRHRRTIALQRKQG